MPVTKVHHRMVDLENKCFSNYSCLEIDIQCNINKPSFMLGYRARKSGNERNLIKSLEKSS